MNHKICDELSSFKKNMEVYSKLDLKWCLNDQIKNNFWH